jgi:sulfite reductase (NADPH) flavoprotein alpha-component
MLEEVKLKQLHQLIESISNEELIWMNGYLAGLVANGKKNGGDHNHNGHAIKSMGVKKISLVFGTETGNSKRLATNLATVAKRKGIHVKLTGLDQYRLDDLANEEYFFVVISTQGEGDPPAPAKVFYDHIHQNQLTLPNLKYSVLALGDTSYPLYCKTGEDVDTQLQSFGATRVVPLQKCDLDYEEDAQHWFEQVLNFLERQFTLSNTELVKPVVKKITGKKYYNGTIRTNLNLNDRGSNKQTFHIEIGADERIEYEPGDAVAIIPVNKNEIVEQIISLTGANRNAVVETARAKATIEELLTKHLNICYLLSSAVKKYAAIAQQDIPDVRIDLVDLLRIYPLKDSSQFTEVIKILSPIAPRLYSISSSPAAHGSNEIHMTVSRHSFRVKEEQRFGLCSDFLGEQPVGTKVNFYIHKNRSFKLPGADKDIIMIGPGTGIAPFRSFLAERDATGTAGKNWLFFGEQHFTADFLYQAEMQNLFNTGVLTKINLAFSRDQEKKIYVQHRIQEQAKELFAWIQNGASIFVSGTKDPNSKDIEIALLQVIGEEGQLSKEEAKKYLKQLEEENRYEKDVY